MTCYSWGNLINPLVLTGLFFAKKMQSQIVHLFLHCPLNVGLWHKLFRLASLESQSTPFSCFLLGRHLFKRTIKPYAWKEINKGYLQCISVNFSILGLLCFTGVTKNSSENYQPWNFLLNHAYTLENWCILYGCSSNSCLVYIIQNLRKISNYVWFLLLN